jgi:hypothetical protein
MAASPATATERPRTSGRVDVLDFSGLAERFADGAIKAARVSDLDAARTSRGLAWIDEHRAAQLRAHLAAIDAGSANPLDRALERARLLVMVGGRSHYVGKVSRDPEWTVAAAMLPEWQGAGYEVRARIEARTARVYRHSAGPRCELMR